MVPDTVPALKLRRPARKSVSDSPSVDAVSPLTSMRASRPNMMPFGLSRNTWPFDCSAPRTWLGSCPVMRFSTTLLALSWTNRVTSPALTVNDCQLMIVFGVLVIVNTLPSWTKIAWPLTTCGRVGAAWAAPKQPATSTGRNFRFMLLFIA